MLQFSNKKSSGTSISKLIKFVLLISIFIAVPPYLFAQNTTNQDIKKYKNCLGGEYGKLDAAVEKLKDLMQANNVKLETYVPTTRGLKDKNFEKLCKVPGLSAWVTYLCKVYNGGQWYSKKIAKLQSDKVNATYKTWLKNNLKECYRPLNDIDLPKLKGIDGIQGNDNDIKLIHSLMKKGRDKYCREINTTTNTIKNLKEKCSIVPNITGKCLDEARQALLHVYLFPEINVKGIESNDESRWKIYKQSPAAGILLKNISSKVNVSIQNTIVNIETKPDVWLNANPGGFKQLNATAYFKCNTTSSSLDLIKKKAGDWKSSNHNIATVQNGRITISKKAKNGQEVTITVTYPDKGPLKTRKSKQIKVKVKTESNLKEIVLKPQGSTLLKSLDPPKEIKAFAIFSDGSKKEITKAKEITWKANQSSINFYEKGEMTIPAICWKSFKIKVTADYQYKGKTYQSKPLVYKIHPDYTYVPWVIKEQKAKAINMLKKNQLIPKVQEYAAFDKHYKINEVIFQDPLYCVIVKKGSKVVLTINPDPAKNKIKVPDLFGKNFSETNSIITKLGLSLQVKYFSSYNEKFKPETVVTQNPKKGTLVLPGAWITVTLNRKSKKIEMPNLLCMTEQQARSILAPLNLRLSATVASSYDTQCKKGEIIEQSPRKGETVLRGSTVKVLINPSSKPLIGIKIKPEEKRSYPLNTKLTLIENVTLKTKGNTYRFKWYHNNKLVSTERSYTHIYKKPGQHTIILDMISSDSRENDTIRTSIDIEYPTIQEAECNVDFEPKKIKYKEGDRVTFVASGRNLGGVTEYQWYVNGRKVGSGTSFTYIFKNQGTYTVKLGLRMGSNFDEKTCQKSIVIGSGLRPTGERNHFTDKGGMNNLSIYSKYWMGGFGKWSNYSKFRKIGSVDGYRLCTGAQADLFNAGFLVYKKKDSDKLRFEVYHFNFVKKSGTVQYSGNIPKSRNPKPESIATQCHQNMVEVSWINEDGSECNTKIWKYRYSSLLAHYGVDEPTCTKPIISSNKLKRCKKFAKTALKQYEENIKRQCNLSGPEWHDDEERHKNWCLNVSKREADDLTKNRENALKRCVLTLCDSYANLAIEQNEKNILYRCGYKGRRWQSNYGNHLGWCQSVSKKASNTETKKREQLLQRCIGASKGVCNKYAKKALGQNEENLRRECGFCGVRWQSNYDNHLQWCLKHKDMRNSEEKARAELLRSKCPSVHRGERTFYEPCFNGYRLDNCLNHGRNCVKPAADKFCESKGYVKARNQKLQKVKPTYIMDDNRICDADYCAGFKYITCSGYTNPSNKTPECHIKEPKSGIVVQSGKYVHFKAEASDEDKDRLKYNWKFEGGSPAKWESEQTSSITTQWRKSGIYTATLTVTDKKGGSCTDTIAVTVQNKGSTFDCDQYADKSVSQNEENLRKKCGLTGELWHSSKSAHTNWCYNGNQGNVAQVIASREKALSKCTKPVVIDTKLTCEITSPSKLAFTDAGKPLEFKGSASGNNLSYDWKFDGYKTEPSSSSRQNPGNVTFKWGGNYKATLVVTDAKGNTCKDSRDILVYDNKDPREFCEGYAAISVKQYRKNIQNNCGYTGEYWTENEYKHQTWCQSVSMAQARNGLTIRNEALRKCQGKSNSSIITKGNDNNVFSCKHKDNVEKGCCCFKGTHSYEFSPRYVKNVLAQFDTGRMLNCKSNVSLSIDRGNGWKKIKTIQANSSKGNSEVAPVEVLLSIGSTIKGFSISDGCVCCIDSSKIILNTNYSGGTPPQPPVKTTSKFKNALSKPCASDKEFIRSLYQSILDRNPNVDISLKPGHGAAHLHDLQNGISRWRVIWNFFNSPEYKNKQKNHHNFIRDVYQSVYGREPQEKEIGYWPQVDRNNILRKFFNSDEYISLMAKCPHTITAGSLHSGTYQVEQGRYKSTWKLHVSNGQISGTSEWSCCPGHRIDAVRGTISGNSVVIERDCSGQKWNGSCQQTYKGKIKGNRITGPCSGTGLNAGDTWVLYLNGSNSNNKDINGNATPKSSVDITGKWKWFNGVIVTINKYGKVSGSNGGKGKVSVNSSNNIEYIFKWNNGYTDNLKLHGDTLDGHNQNGTHVWGKRIISGNNNYINENVWALNAANNIFKWNGKNWDIYAGKAQDIGVGANGSVWIMDTENHRYGGSVYRLEGSNFVKTSGQGVRIDVDPYGNPWVINNLSNIYKWQNNAWHRMPGLAKDIGIGANGDVWIIGTDATNGNYGIYKWSGSQWVKFPGAAVRIDVGPKGAPWVVNSFDDIYKWEGNHWIHMPGKAKDISIGADGEVLVVGTNPVAGGYGIYKWNGSKWLNLPGGATAISVGGKK